ncbi:TIGR04222 domain-containing membrane protein [Streptomyces sp. NPDC047009]|uniref:TIGR04222 domain-containing membrane protein n=1 Tax=Streptomyces sp. NPDC047009 TaxID=3154496 RepID=UPI0033F4E9F7
MDTTSTIRLEPHEIAFLRGGPRAAVTVAVLTLHLRGAVGPGRPATMRTTGALNDPEQAVPALTKAVHSALYRTAGMGQLLERQGVRSALTEVRRGLRAAGLLRAFPPGPTWTARRTLRSLRARDPLPESRTGLTNDELLLAVALYGDQALTSLVPRFARAAGLVGRAGTTELELRPGWGATGGSGDGGGCGMA